ncbi:cell division protein ZapD [Sphaerotilus mobilis]|uniref:Cell division protein ZapD n=1 Tax=Sphaerotilus mobilis TaxID=47994 RepID=A0A4Q7LB60_9BURK|nr:cell division protein ZapD [Sphaerotilus mobilis]
MEQFRPLSGPSGSAPATPGSQRTLSTFEYPFNESVRTWLRLEHLLARLAELVRRDSVIDHHYALATLFEVMDVTSRADLKLELLQDLERQRQTLASYRGNPAISEAALDRAIRRIDLAHQRLGQTSGKAGQALTANDFLMSVRSRIGIPGGTCAFDLPAYAAWQSETADTRRGDLQRWLSTLEPLALACGVALDLLRESGLRQTQLARGGHLQQSLPSGRNFQLARVHLPDELGMVPELSGNRLMLVVRLMRADSDCRLRGVVEDVALEVSLCA